MLLSEVAVSQLTVSQRIAAVVSFGLIIVNMINAPKFATMWKNGKIAEIHRLSSQSTRFQLLIVSPVFLVSFIFPDMVLGFFGEGYSESGWILRILLLGQIVNSLCGSVAYILTMTNNEKLFRNATFVSGPSTLVLTIVGANYYGVYGVAMATAFGLSLQNILSLLYVRLRLGFWTFW